MTVRLNNQTIMQPSDLHEIPLPIQSEVVSLDGSVQRNYTATKYQAELSWTFLTISGYQQLYSMFTTGSGVVYWNDLTAFPVSPLTFSGLPTIKTYSYQKGASLYQQLDVSIRQY